MLTNKNIILGVTGGIAAYKCANLTRLLIKEGANVKVVMTPLAKEFITPLTLATLSKNPILVDFFNPENGDWNSHVDLGLWADAYVIAPATANSIAKMAHGIADNLLLTTYLSARCPVFIAPAMDLDMFQHCTTQQNISSLRSRGNIVIEPATGELASGLSGKGRMEEPDEIVQGIKEYFSHSQKLKGKNCLITAGPTHEPIDPVRYIGNRSSGKMGYAIAEEMANQGAKVELISGPVNISVSNPLITVHDVNTAQEMYTSATKLFPKVDIAIMAAAVADFAPSNIFNQKVKEKSNNFQLELRPTKDIAAELGRLKTANQILVGFALETDKEVENAKEKLQKKKLDFIVLNSLREKGAGFQHDTNKITIIDKYNKIDKFELKLKKEVAIDIVGKIIEISKTTVFA